MSKFFSVGSTRFILSKWALCVACENGLPHLRSYVHGITSYLKLFTKISYRIVTFNKLLFISSYSTIHLYCNVDRYVFFPSNAGAEVKPGESVKAKPDVKKLICVSQVCSHCTYTIC